MSTRSKLRVPLGPTCFKGGMSPRGNLRRVLAGAGLQMFQQWTGINFICECDDQDKKILDPYN